MNDSVNELLPLLRLSVFCDRVLQEKDETITLVRIIDRVVITATSGKEGSEPPEEMPHGVTRLFYVLSTIWRSSRRTNVGVASRTS